MLLNAIAQAAVGSYLQTSIIAVASLFGPSALQAMMSGQAAVGVAVSGVQVISSAISSRRSHPSEVSLASSPEESSAFVFFGLATLFLLGSAVVETWLIKLPAYTSVMGQFEHINAVVNGAENSDENSGLISTNQSFTQSKKDQITRVAKANMKYNVAVAYVFIVTLVRVFMYLLPLTTLSFEY